MPPPRHLSITDFHVAHPQRGEYPEMLQTEEPEKPESFTVRASRQDLTEILSTSGPSARGWSDASEVSARRPPFSDRPQAFNSSMT